MNVEDVAKLLDAISKLFGTLVWPALIVFVLVKYKSSFGAFFEAMTEITFKAAGVEASLKKNKADATAALVTANVARTEAGASAETTASVVRAATAAVEAVTPRTIRQASKSRILWVDDRPANNVNEQRALEALGIDFTISTSTEDAMNKLGNQNFDLVISDMGRPPDSRAGYTLLEKMRSSGDTTPVIFYAGSRTVEHMAESRMRGALGCTNQPNELFEYVLSAVGRGK